MHLCGLYEVVAFSGSVKSLNRKGKCLCWLWGIVLTSIYEQPKWWFPLLSNAKVLLKCDIVIKIALKHWVLLEAIQKSLLLFVSSRLSSPKLTFYQSSVGQDWWRGSPRCSLRGSAQLWLGTALRLDGCFLFLQVPQAFYWKCWRLAIFSFPSNTSSCQFCQLVLMILLISCYLFLSTFLFPLFFSPPSAVCFFSPPPITCDLCVPG